MTDLKEQTDLCMTTLDAALSHDGDRVDEALNTVGTKYGWNGLFNVVCGFASALLQLDPIPGDQDQFVGLAAVNLKTGQQVSVEETGVQPELIAASRIITAIANDDHGAARDVFDAEVAAERGTDAVCAVLAVVSVRIEQQHPRFRDVYGDQS